MKSSPIDFSKMRSAEWDYTSMTGGGIISLICPACSSHVPFGNDAAGVSYRERHIRFHEVNVDLVSS